MKEANKKRILWLDYAKAFAMFFVVIGHVNSGNYLTNWIYSFHMPLFFFLSGITLKAYRGGWKHYVIKLSKRILIPYFGYLLLYFLYDFMQVILLHKDINLVKAFIGIFIQIRGTEYTLGLWFLPLLFITEILEYLFVLQKDKIQIVIMMLIASIGFFYASIFKQVLPWGIDAVPIAMVFVWLGYIYKNKFIFKFEYLKRYGLFIILPVLLLSIFWCNCNVTILGTSVDMHKMLYGNPFIYLLAAIHGILFILLICQIIFDKRDIHFLQFVGGNTLHIYCLHGLILPFLKKGLEIFVNRIEIVNVSVFLQVIIAAVTIFICMIVIQKSQMMMEIFGVKKE